MVAATSAAGLPGIAGPHVQPLSSMLKGNYNKTFEYYVGRSAAGQSMILQGLSQTVPTQ